MKKLYRYLSMSLILFILALPEDVAAAVDCSEIVEWKDACHNPGTQVKHKDKVYQNNLSGQICFGEPGVSANWTYVADCLPPINVTAISVSPSGEVFAARGGASVQFNANVTVSPNEEQYKAVDWSVTGSNPSGASSITNGGVLTVGADETATSLTVKATSKENNTKSATVTVSVVDMSITSVSVDPSTIELERGGDAYKFSAIVVQMYGAPETVTWTIEGNNSLETSIDGDGYLSIDISESANEITVIATSTFDGLKFGTATVSVVNVGTPAVTKVEISPKTVTIPNGGQRQFDAVLSKVYDDGDLDGVIWSISNATPVYAAGTYIDENDGTLYVDFEETATTIKVIATSIFDATQKDEATVNVVGVITGVTISPKTASVKSEKSLNFTVEVGKSGLFTGDVIWGIDGNSSASTMLSNQSNTGATLTVGPASSESASQINVWVKSTEDGDKSDMSVITIQRLFNCAIITSFPIDWWFDLKAGDIYKADDKVYKVKNNGGVSGKNDGKVETISNWQNYFEFIGECAPTITVTSVSVSPSSASAAKSKTLQFTASVAVNPNDNEYKSVTWSVSGKTSAQTEINSSGLLTVGADETATSLTVTATSKENTAIKGSATVNIIEGEVTSIIISPDEISLDRFNKIGDGDTKTFTASVIVDPITANNGVIWAVLNSAKSSIAPNGVFTLAQDEEENEIIIEATAIADPSEKAQAIVTNSKIKTLSIEPLYQEIATNAETVNFDLNVQTTGLYTGAVTWNIISSVKTGTVLTPTANGAELKIAADETAVSIEVEARSIEDTDKSYIAKVVITGNTPTVNDVTIEANDGYIVEKGKNLALDVTVDGVNIEGDDVIWKITTQGHADGTSVSGDKDGAILTVAANETIRTIKVKASSKEFPEKSDEVTITVKAVWGVTVSSTPSSVTSVERGKSQRFSESVDATGEASQEVLWSIEGSTNAATTISIDGLLQVAADETAVSIKVTATSKFDPTISGEATVTIAKPDVESVKILPNDDFCIKGQTLSFTTEVLPAAADQGIEWSIIGKESAATTINDGVLSVGADETANEITVVAKSSVNAREDRVKINIINGVVTKFEIQDKEITLIKNQTHQFSVDIEVEPVSGTGVDWAIISNNSNSTISEDGLFTLAQNEELDTIEIEAASKIDPSKKDRAIIINSKVKSIEIIQGKTQDATMGDIVEFTAEVSVTGLYDGEIDWEILSPVENGTDISSISASGVTADGVTTVTSEMTLTIAADETAYKIKIAFKSLEEDVSDTAIITIGANKPTIEVTGVTLSAQTTTVQKGGSVALTVEVEVEGNVDEEDIDVIWEIIGDAAEGTVLIDKSRTGAVLTIAKDEAEDEIEVKASSKDDPDKFDIVTIAVKKVKSVVISPNPATAEKGGTLKFEAIVSVSGEADQAVTWKKSGGLGTTNINNSGLLTVSSGETASEIKIIATSNFDNEKADTVTVVIRAKAVESVSVTANMASVDRGSKLQFTATVLPDNAPQTLIWTVTGATASSIDENGLLTVSENETANTISVVATATDGSQKFDAFIVTVNKPIAISGAAKGRGDFGILLYNAVVSEKAEFEVLTPEPADVSVAIIDNQGNVLFVEKGGTQKTDGVNSLKVEWKLNNENGRGVASGTYIIQATAKNGGKNYRYAVPVGVKR
ncbi:MAG: Ig-like domain-containing protein [Chitinispirillales bacterium]|nr:Ig-like domain-containing protein [Chitinispirillales bacterium]